MKEKVAQSLLSVWDSTVMNSTIRLYHISCSLKPIHLDAHLLEVLAYTKKDLKDDTDGTGLGTQTEQQAWAKLRPSEQGLWKDTSKDDDSGADEGAGHDISVTIGPGEPHCLCSHFP